MRRAALLLFALLACISTAGQAHAADRLVSADVRRVRGPLDTMFKACVGAGRANEGLRADWQRQLAYVHEQCGFTYVRMHGLLSVFLLVLEKRAPGAARRSQNAPSRTASPMTDPFPGAVREGQPASP